jgi:hypothetical protein
MAGGGATAKRIIQISALALVCPWAAEAFSASFCSRICFVSDLVCFACNYYHADTAGEAKLGPNFI